MKKLLVLAALLAFVAPYAALAGNASGCGLGQTFFAGQSGLVPNVLAATTNGTLGNNTFGMTTGTSGCNANDTVNIDTVQTEFVALNYEKLSEEMAQGGGQYLSALGELMGCDASAHTRLGEVSQSNYESLFSAPEGDAKALLSGLKQEMANDALLAGGCTRIS